jgi:sucrose phosphorylase
LLARTGVGRDINRHHYTRGEIEEALARPVVADLLALIRLRNTHPAFQGAFELLASEPEVLEMRWHSAGAHARLRVHLPTADHSLVVSPLQDPPDFRILRVSEG